MPISEAVTNAVVHGRPDVTLTLTIDFPCITVEVDDTGAGFPVLPQGETPPLGSSNGRGLHIINALATRWGITKTNGAGKTVWFELRPTTD